MGNGCIVWMIDFIVALVIVNTYCVCSLFGKEALNGYRNESFINIFVRYLQNIFLMTVRNEIFVTLRKIVAFYAGFLYRKEYFRTDLQLCRFYMYVYNNYNVVAFSSYR